jgi:hypothetical protein
VVTDIDFVAYEHETRTLLLFQLKWQQPSVNDDRVRRSNATNLVNASNDWVQAVHDWVSCVGIDCVMQRLGLIDSGATSFHTIVLGRYHAHFTGAKDLDGRAVWADWGHFLRQLQLHPSIAAKEFVDALRTTMGKATIEVQRESMVLLLPEIALLVNPSKVEEGAQK